jgi:hypothetical protein
MKEKKDVCKLCKKSMMSSYELVTEKKWFKKHDTIHVKCKDWLDEVFHAKCWERLKIY